MNRPKCSAELEALLQGTDMPPYPDAAKAASVCYTDYLTGAHSHVFSADPKTGDEYVYTPPRNRQCSIGWHTECTLDGCGCVCHEIMDLIADERGALEAAVLSAADGDSKPALKLADELRREP